MSDIHKNSKCHICPHRLFFDGILISHLSNVIHILYILVILFYEPIMQYLGCLV